jgi:hypothetical protein
MFRMFSGKRKAIVAGAAFVALTAAAFNVPVSKRPASGSARPFIAQGPVRAAQLGETCTTGTTAPFYCLGGANLSAVNGFTYGVYGVEGYAPNATGGIGVLGYSGGTSVRNAYGEYGVTFSPEGIGVYGAGDGPTPAPGATPSNTQQSTGVVGNSASGAGVFGSTQFPNASQEQINAIAGVEGVDGAGTEFNDGVLGITSGGGYGVQGSSGNNAEGGVYAYATSGDGVDAFTSSGTGVSAVSTSSDGVDGFSNSSSGVFGSSNEGYGVWGSSSSSDAVHASSSSGTALVGISSSGEALSAQGGGAIGAYVSTTGSSGTGLEAVGPGVGVEAGSSSSYEGLTADATTFGIIASTEGSGTEYPLVLFNNYPSTTEVAQVDNSGNMDIAGTYSATLVRTRHGFSVKSYLARTSAPTVEDVGSAQLVNGTALVRIDPAMAESMDESTAYHVFLTPDADTKGLFVAQKTPQGFVVRETQGGRGTFAFDYRIVGSVDGQATTRMALSTQKQMTGPTIHRPVFKATAITRGVVPKTFAQRAALQRSHKLARHAGFSPPHIYMPQPNLAVETRLH